MSQVYENVSSIYERIKGSVPFCPKVALVLGSGLGDFAEMIEKKGEIPYSEIPDFPVSTVPGHKGKFVFGYVGQVPVVIMQGRVHYYEGYAMEQVVLPIRLMKLMGAQVLFVTNAAGGVNEKFQPGDFMMLTDHIAQFIPSPLIGENPPEFGPRFPDMSNAYDGKLQEHIRKIARTLNIPLQEGIYLQFTGPAYETPAEIRMAKTAGADAVGMSTACEVIAANHMGMCVCGISCISNMASGINETPLSHVEVQETADRVAPDFKKLVWHVIEQMP
ncbi:MAG: purine-nucleoside phosphorylase [Lachnospiraceae bacterium]|nr:purine-nucleoside phosphorylase [Lachnospiraceae bacterium]